MRKITLAILVMVFLGCKNFETRKLSPEEVLSQKLEHFEWDQVDVYPSFDSCKDILERAESKKCFERTLAKHIQAFLSKRPIIARDSVNTVVYLYLAISKKGVAKIDSLEIPSGLLQKLPGIKTRLSQSLDSLPKIQPAQTRGIPVSVRFTLPVRIVSN